MAAEANPSLLRQHAAVILARQASGIKKPNLERRAGLLRNGLVQFDIIIGDDHCTSSCEGVRHIGSQSNSQRNNAAAEIVTAAVLNITIPPNKPAL